jgi:hypothetical protein
MIGAEQQRGNGLLTILTFRKIYAPKSDTGKSGGRLVESVSKVHGLRIGDTALVFANSASLALAIPLLIPKLKNDVLNLKVRKTPHLAEPEEPQPSF